MGPACAVWAGGTDRRSCLLAAMGALPFAAISTLKFAFVTTDGSTHSRVESSNWRGPRRTVDRRGRLLQNSERHRMVPQGSLLRDNFLEMSCILAGSFSLAIAAKRQAKKMKKTLRAMPFGRKRNFAAEQTQLKLDESQAETAAARAETQEVMLKLRSLEKKLQDAEAEVLNIERQASDKEKEKEQVLAQLGEIEKAKEESQKETQAAVAKAKTLEKALADLKLEVSKTRDVAATVEGSEKQTLSRLSEIENKLRNSQQETEAAQLKVRALEKALQDAKGEARNTKTRAYKSEMMEVEAKQYVKEAQAAREAQEDRIKELLESLRAVGVLVRKGIQDPRDPVELMEQAQAEAATLKGQLEEREAALQQVTAEKDAAVARTLELEQNLSDFQATRESAKLLTQGLQDIAKKVGAGGYSLFSLFQPKMSGEELITDIKLKLDERTTT